MTDIEIIQKTNKGTKSKSSYLRGCGSDYLREPEKLHREYQRRDEIRIANRYQMNPRRR